MKVSKAYSSVSLSDATELLASSGHLVTYLFSGEMGIGKSSMLKSLKKKFGDKYHYCYVDMTIKDVGDFLIPKIMTVDGVEVCRFVPNEEFGVHLDKPVICMFDELGKAMRAVLNASLRPILERALGGYLFPEGSIVFATTNLSIEGLGDVIPAHARNRMVQCEVRKPTAMEWVEDYAIPHQLEPVVIGTVIEFPQMFQSFKEIEDPASNRYINDPRCPRTAVVTHRSMESASKVYRATKHLPDDVRLHALAGAIGEAAALDMMTIVKLDEELPTWDQILRDPEATKVSSSAVANCMIVSKACMRVERESFGAWMTYCKRLPKEVQALFAKTIMRGEKMALAATFADFTAWAKDNMYLFTK
jgi:MoxR-like ATPase